MTRPWSVIGTVFFGLSGLCAQSVPDSGWIRVVTTPPGVSVYVDGVVAGQSPIDSLRLPTGTHVVHYQRLGPFRWTPRAVAETVEVRLNEVSPLDAYLPPDVDALLTTHAATGVSGPREEHGRVMTGPGAWGVQSETWTLTAGGAMVVSGVLAAVFRDRANAAAARYTQTGDPQALSEVRTYDRLAGASMVAVQVSLGAFVLFLTNQ